MQSFNDNKTADTQAEIKNKFLIQSNSIIKDFRIEQNGMSFETM